MIKTRYLNADLFNDLVRPQYPSACNISSITTAFRFLFKEDFRQEQFAQILDIDIAHCSLSPGNREIVSWCNQIAERLKLKIKVDIHFEEGWKLSSVDNDTHWGKLKSIVHEKNSVGIIHIESHYALILGYGWFPEQPVKMNAETGNRWLFIADPSPYHKQSKINKQHKDCSPPIWSLRWGVVREQFTEHSHYGIIQIRSL